MQNIKYCSLCNKTFTDLSISFCPFDATALEELRPMQSKENSTAPPVERELDEEPPKLDETTLSVNMDLPLRQILGLIGSLVLFVGVFSPLISLPIIGNVNYFNNGKGDGVFILALVVFSIFLTISKKYEFLGYTGTSALAILAVTFVSFHFKFSQIKEDMPKNPFGEIGQTMLDTVQFQWGLAVLIIGAGLLIAAGLMKGTAQKANFEGAENELNDTSKTGSYLPFILAIILIVWFCLFAYRILADS